MRTPPPFWFPAKAKAPTGEGPNSSEDEEARNFKVLGARDISLME